MELSNSQAANNIGHIACLKAVLGYLKDAAINPVSTANINNGVVVEPRRIFPHLLPFALIKKFIAFTDEIGSGHHHQHMKVWMYLLRGIRAPLPPPYEGDYCVVIIKKAS